MVDWLKELPLKNNKNDQ